jgi:hypothetical protein
VRRESRARVFTPRTEWHTKGFLSARGSLSDFSPGGVESHKITSLSVSSAQSPCPERVRSPLYLTLSLARSAIFEAAFRDEKNDQNKQNSPQRSTGRGISRNRIFCRESKQLFSGIRALNIQCQCESAQSFKCDESGEELRDEREQSSGSAPGAKRRNFLHPTGLRGDV